VKTLALSLILAPVMLAAWPVKVLLVTGSSDEPHHHWRETSATLRQILEQSGRFTVSTVDEPRGLNALALEGYDAVLLDYNGPRLPVAAEAALESFVRNGGGFASFHQACYGTFFGMQLKDGRWQAGPPDTEWAAFARMIGAQWEPSKIGHARRTAFPVDWRDGGHPISQGQPRSFIANDELYHKLTLDKTVQVLADAMSPVDLGGTGQREPLIWVNRYGKGRVFFTTLGHDTMAWYQQGLSDAMTRGLEWAATGQVAVIETALRPTRLLVVTGGHAYPKEFYAMLDSLTGIRWSHASSQAEAFSQPIVDRYDVVLLHDMAEGLAEPLRANLKAFVDAGKGVVSIHHAVVDYTDWPWWYEQVTGGKYFVKEVAGHAASRYHEGVEFLVTPVKGQESHPVLRGVGPLWVNDEAYRNMSFAPGITPLMETAFAENDRPVVYVGPGKAARVVYIQLGHSATTMGNPGFRRLVRNAVQWTGEDHGKAK
jgi:type 1 glutamine amidotransferase